MYVFPRNIEEDTVSCGRANLTPGQGSLLTLRPASAMSASPLESACGVCQSALKEGSSLYRCTDCILKKFDLCEKCFNDGEGEKHLQQFGPEHRLVKETEVWYQGSKLIIDEKLENAILNMFKFYANRPSLGEFHPDKNAYEYLTFTELCSQVQLFYSGLDALLTSMPNKFVAFCANSSVQWYTADLACLLLGAVSVPFGVTFDPSQMEHILNQTEASVLLCDAGSLEKMLSIVPRCSGVKVVIVMGRKVEPPTKLPVTNDKQRFLSFKDVLDMGAANPVPFGKYTMQPDDVASILYTSGTCGNPKGCILSREVIWRRMKVKLQPRFAALKVWFSYQPPSHVVDRFNTLPCLLNGGRVATYRGTVDHILEDLSLVRPMWHLSTPRFFQLIYTRYQQSIRDLTAKYKSEGETEGAELQQKVEMEAKAKVRALLGGRFIVIIVGGAPSGEDLKAFLRSLCPPYGMFGDGFGSTETDNVILGGMPMPGVEVKLVDVPELGYFTTSDPPRGELLVKNNFMMSGYFKNEEETAKVMQDGYFRTGDVAEKQGEQYFIIDRVKSIFKLAQGEYVTPSHLETLFADNTSYINQVFVYGNSLWDHVVAVVVPNMTTIKEWWEREGGDVSASNEEICQSTELNALLMSDIHKTAQTHKLEGWEVPIAICIEMEPFSPENGLLTLSHKLSRIPLVKKYKPVLETLYASATASKEKDSLHAQFAGVVCGCFQRGNPAPAGDPSVELVSSTFTQLGGDSLAALLVVGAIQRETNAVVPPEVVLAGRAAEVVQYMAEKMGLKVVNEELYSKLEPHDRAEQLPTAKSDLEVMLEDTDLELWVQNLTPPIPRSINGSGDGPKAVLLTGSSGFLGRHLLLTLLQHPGCSKVYCHTLGRTKGAAHPSVLRLLEEVAGPDLKAGLSQAFEAKAVVLEGDLAKPLLGLDEAVFADLASSVDVIIHNGAYVNHVLPYQSLKAVNVDSTKELLRLAMSGRPKLFHFVSTVSVFLGLAPGGTPEENADLDFTMINRESYAAGYAQSKLVSETLLRKACEKGYTAVSISRPGLIGPHSTSGVGNKKDVLYWLVHAAAEMGVVPTGPVCRETPLHLAPVDYVAEAITALSLAKCQDPTVGGRKASVYHLVNSSQPVSYEEFFQTLKSVKSGMKEIDYAAFAKKLKESAAASNSVVLTAAHSLQTLAGGLPPSSVFSDAATRMTLEELGVKHLGLGPEYLQLYFQVLFRGRPKG